MAKQKNIEELAEVFRALSDPGRFRIVKMLEHRDLCVCEITAVLGLAASTVSKHLSILREAGIIADERKGKWVNYRLNPDMNDEQLRILLPLIRGWANEDAQIRNDVSSLGSCSRDTLCGIE